MATVTFITPGGEQVVIEDATGNLMEIATDNDVDGIDGDCGGVCSCATCHVHVHPEWVEHTGSPDDIEQGMLDMEDDVDERSRLCCQIDMSDDLDGLVVEVVKSK